MPVLETREYALFYKKLLRLFGLYYFKDDTKITKFLRDTWMWFIASVFLLTSVQALILLLGRSEFDLKRDSFGVLLVFVKAGGCYHVMYYYYQREKVRKILDDMSEVFHFSSTTGLEEIDMIGTIDYGRRLWLSWFGFLSVAFFIVLWPLVTKGRKLALDLWYPFDWTKSPTFQFTYLMQIIIEALMLLTYAICDGGFPLFSALITGQFEVLGHNITNVVNTALLKCNVPKTLVEKFSKQFNNYGIEDKDNNGRLSKQEEIVIFEVLKHEEFDETLCDIFKRYIEHHQVILKYCARIEDLYSPYQLIKVFLNRLYFCLELICVMLFLDTDIAFVVAVASYAFAALYELFLQTYSGQKVQDAALILRERLYELPWYFCPKHFLKLFKFAHLRSERKLIFTTGKIAKLDTETFVVFLNMVLSYFAVLRNTMK